MRVYEFADVMRYTNLKDLVMIKRGGEFIRKCRVEDLPWRPSTIRHAEVKFVDEHIDAIHMESVWHPEALAPDYCITIDLFEEPRY